MRTITLTHRRPVSIEESNWPVIALANYKWFDNEYEFQANRIQTGHITVRRHEDGRALVYGKVSYRSNWPSEDGWDYRAGELLTSDHDLDAEIPKAILRTADFLFQKCAQTWVTDLANKAIADLPPEVL